MTNLVIEALVRLDDDLSTIGASWALVGGLAVSAHAEPRFTRDVDVCIVAGDDESAEGVARALGRLGYAVGGVVEHERLERLATVRLSSPVPGGVVVDLLFASSGVEAEIVASAERLEVIPGLVVPLARAGSLVVLKLLARDDVLRPQDAQDLRSLRPVLTPADVAEARILAGLVASRGSDRGRDLPALLEDYLGEAFAT